MNQPTTSLLQKQRYRSKLIIILICCNIALSSFYFGYMNNSFGTLNLKTMIDIFKIPYSPGVASGIVNGIVPLSSIAGALITYQFIVNSSRRKILLIANAVALFANLLVFTENFHFLLFARFLQGGCVGCFITMAPMMIRQIAPTQIAGILGSISQIFMTSGVTFACVLQYTLTQIFEDYENRYIWKYVFGFPIITVSLQTIIFLFVFPYETPKYLISIGQKQKTKELIEILYQERYVQEIEMEKVEDFKHKKQHDQQLAQIQRQEYGQQPSIFTKMKSNAWKIAMVILLMQQLSGINPVSIYGYQITKQSTQSIRQLVPSIINGIQLIGTLKSSYLLLHYGRKDLFVHGSRGMGVFLIATFVGLIIQPLSNGFGTAIIIVGLMGFSLLFGMTLGPVTWLYASEVLDPELIPYGVIANRFTAFLSIMLFPIITNKILDGDCSILFLFFGILMFMYFKFCQQNLIETKGKEEKEIRKELKSTHIHLF